MLTNDVKYPRRAKGQTSAAYLSSATTCLYSRSAERLKDAPRQATNELAGKQHWQRGRKHGDKDGTDHGDHGAAVDALRAESGLGVAIDDQTNDLTDTGGIVDGCLPVGGDIAFTIGVNTTKAFQERGLSPKGVDLISSVQITLTIPKS